MPRTLRVRDLMKALRKLPPDMELMGFVGVGLFKPVRSWGKLLTLMKVWEVTSLQGDGCWTIDPGSLPATSPLRKKKRVLGIG